MLLPAPLTPPLPLLPSPLPGMGPRSPAFMTAQTLEAMIDTIGEFFKRQPTGGRCQNCGAHNPTIKRCGDRGGGLAVEGGRGLGRGG